MAAPSPAAPQSAPQSPPPLRPGLSLPAPAEPTDALEGEWRVEQASLGTDPIEASLVFTRNNGALSGILRVGESTTSLFEVRQMGTNVTLTRVIPGSPYVTVNYSGMLIGDELTLASEDNKYGLIARRVAATRPSGELARLTPPPLDAVPLPAERPGARVASLSPPPALRPQASLRTPTNPVLPPLKDLPPNNLAKTPPMGWASKGQLGVAIDDDIIRQAAEGLDESGLRAAGYVFLEVGEGWQGTRDENGALKGNEKFPAMKALGDFIHEKGLKFGLTLAAGVKSCGGYEGSYGHEEADAKTLASWGVDYVVYDWCGAQDLYKTQAEQQAASQKMGEALRATGRNIVFAISQTEASDLPRWAAKAGANLSRMAGEGDKDWQSVMRAGFAQNGKEGFAGPGKWNDPGFIQVGNGGMSPDEYRSQLNLWVILAAPLMLSTDVRIMMRDTVSLLTNEELIGINQDGLGQQGKRVAQNGTTEVWARTLSDGSTAVAFFNRGEAGAPAAVTWQQLGIEGPRRVRDLWWHQNIGTANGRYAVFLSGHTSMLLRLSP